MYMAVSQCRTSGYENFTIVSPSRTEGHTITIEDKSVFLDIMKQVQLPSVQVQVRTVEEMEKIEGKTYRELTLMCHLPNFKRINPNFKEQTRTMAVCMYFVLYEHITSIRASQTGCATDFRCQTMTFK